VGISLENCPGALVYNNTVFLEHDYPHAIEYRFSPTSDVLIANNLTNLAITSRDGATGTILKNKTSAVAEWFMDPSDGDLHLAFAVPGVIDRGTDSIPSLPVPFYDYDEEVRPKGEAIDIGADEFGESEFDVDIISPGDGADVCGTVRVKTSVSEKNEIKNVKFFINGVLEKDDHSSPYSFVWRCLNYSNGLYTLKARAFDQSGKTVSDKIKVHLANEILTLGAVMCVERTWVLRKKYVKIDLNVVTCGCAETASEYVIYRAENSEEFNTLKSISPSELEDGNITFYDTLIEENHIYSYWAEAKLSNGNVIGISGMIALNSGFIDF
jgi:hypothetical protein